MLFANAERTKQQRFGEIQPPKLLVNRRQIVGVFGGDEIIGAELFLGQTGSIFRERQGVQQRSLLVKPQALLGRIEQRRGLAKRCHRP